MTESTVETVVTPATPETQPDKTGAVVTFTQADVDRLIGERLKRERETSQAKLLSDLGIENIDGLKTLVSTHKETELAKKTEVEKWQAKYEDLQKKFSGLETQVTEFKTKEVKATRNNAILGALKDAKASDAEDLLVILKENYADKVDAVLGEDNAVNKKAVEDLVKLARENKPKFFASQLPGSQSNRNGKPVQQDNKVVLRQRINF